MIQKEISPPLFLGLRPEWRRAVQLNDSVLKIDCTTVGWTFQEKSSHQHKLCLIAYKTWFV